MMNLYILMHITKEIWQSRSSVLMMSDDRIGQPLETVAPILMIFDNRIRQSLETVAPVL